MTKQSIYDLAWSPDGKYIIAGSTDNLAQIFSVADGESSKGQQEPENGKQQHQDDVHIRFDPRSDRLSLVRVF